MKFASLFRRNRMADAAHSLYAAVVTQARRDVFYVSGGVPDTVDGRFDMVAVHAHLLLRRLSRGGNDARALSQAVFDIMFADMDQNLREMGIGDLSVGKKVKAMAQAFYGRIAAYDAGLDADDAVLGEALRRNLFRKTSPSDAQVAAMAAYMRRQAAALDAHPVDALVTGTVSFADAWGHD